MRAVVKMIDASAQATGSGCLVAKVAPSEYLVLTGSHVLGTAHGAAVMHYPFGPADVTTQVVEVVARDQKRDFLLLRVRGIPDLPTIPICPKNQVPKGRFPVLVCGFPNGNLTVTTSRAEVEAFVSHQHNVKGTFLVLDHHWDGGISGSPVIAQIGPDRFAVVAVVWGCRGQGGDAEGLASFEVTSFVGKTPYAYLLNQPTRPVDLATVPPARSRSRVVLPDMDGLPIDFQFKAFVEFDDGSRIEMDQFSESFTVRQDDAPGIAGPALRGRRRSSFQRVIIKDDAGRVRIVARQANRVVVEQVHTRN